MSGFCYLVFCHTDPAAALRLVRRIRDLSPDAAVVVRYEDPGYVDESAVRQAGGIPLRSTVRARWGDWGQAWMQVEALRHALATTESDWFVTLSGQCYPVRDLAEWEAQVRATGAGSILNPLPAQPDDHRFTWWVLDPPRLRPPLADRVVKNLGWRLGEALPSAIQLRPRFDGGPAENRWWVGVRKRGYRDRLAGGLQIAKASSWMALSRPVAAAAVGRIDTDDALRADFRRVRNPDENLLQTLATAAGPVRHAPVSEARFPPGRSSPGFLDEATLRDLADTGAPFVRKIGPDAPLSLLALADSLVDRPSTIVLPSGATTGRTTTP